MDLVVLTPEQEYFKGEITSLTVPGLSGEFEVLADHAPLVSALTSGEVKVKKNDGEELRFSVGRGFLEVINNDLALLVNDIKLLD